MWPRLTASDDKLILSLSSWVSRFVLLTRGGNCSGAARIFTESHGNVRAGTYLTLDWHSSVCRCVITEFSYNDGVFYPQREARHQSFHRVRAGHSCSCEASLLDECETSLLDECETSVTLYELRLVVACNEVLVCCKAGWGSWQFQHCQGHSSSS